MGETSPAEIPIIASSSSGKPFGHPTGVDHEPALAHQTLSDQVRMRRSGDPTSTMPAAVSAALPKSPRPRYWKNSWASR